MCSYEYHVQYYENWTMYLKRDSKRCNGIQRIWRTISRKWIKYAAQASLVFPRTFLSFVPSQVLNEVAEFFKVNSEIKRRKIDAPLTYISKAELVIIPDGPVPIDNLYTLNNAHRKKIGNFEISHNCPDFHY